MISLVLPFVILCLILGLTFKIWRPSIDRLNTGEIILWYTSPNTNTRNFTYLWKI